MCYVAKSQTNYMGEKSRTIGILAGMGPRSTGPFINSVVSHCSDIFGAVRDDEYPPMLIYSIPIVLSDRKDEYGDLISKLLIGLGILAEAGADFIAMPCNLAHVFHSELQARINVPLLNMIDIAIDAIPGSSKRVAVIAARGTVASRVYQDSASRRADRDLLFDEVWQGKVDQLIINVKAEGNSPLSIRMFDELLHDFRQAQVDLALLACTDLSGLPSLVPDSLPILDAGNALAAEVVRFYKGNQE